MSPAEVMDSEFAEAAQTLRDNDEPFAFATIVRTAGATAAKPGAKALLAADGTILHGWLGGGCTRGAVRKAALESLKDGTPQLVSVAPEDLLEERGVASGDTVEGTKFARNGCPSRGTVDIFIEPCLPMPELVVLGASPVAKALSQLAPQFHWSISAGLGDENVTRRRRFVVIATQGQGDIDALQSALSEPCDYVAFVGSSKKFASLSERLHGLGVSQEATAKVDAPAGLSIGAVTPEEIALSILGQLVRVRRINTGETT
ncbi:xanthine dehydrogenase accessory factor [Cognatiyoonia sediminum]|uniref:Xanthine dehydrogenase accessory factor n=1 Tax=Cognatiyoonia sediminum TaxID=1508389 RepID=A0A1M5S4M8_9RHOB|nr:XdhC family protein [Cognatiyoonia sediminum]SHH33248.1 xanthine dehydrogenase accessory factor [Cognatiyoonia sediminum]